MKTIKVMDVEQFIDLLLTMQDGDTCDFALTQTYIPDDRDLNSMDLEDWYFATVINITGYNSRFILIDYTGGEEAMAIPLNGYRNGCDEDDRQIVPGFVQKFFKDHNIERVYCEIEDVEDE